MTPTVFQGATGGSLSIAFATFLLCHNFPPQKSLLMRFAQHDDSIFMPNVQAQGREPLCGEASLWSERLGRRVALMKSAADHGTEHFLYLFSARATGNWNWFGIGPGADNLLEFISNYAKHENGKGVIGPVEPNYCQLIGPSLDEYRLGSKFDVWSRIALSSATLSDLFLYGFDGVLFQPVQEVDVHISRGSALSILTGNHNPNGWW